ncbi:hypothetical protein ERO13_D03G046450v2 [Gossypium hirsutum]|uniref:Uncharacterized protein n=1 Tax=Gossypium darwinii TaxID=34276 RepID=A0A5D2D1N8_GOSDA|nr:hypothetical protein ERO13_D03G046450v2 [Gossypium hirsutum]TYG75711.1 hypothetical protein ES288_D03G054200v1 [Gossypium darwinii]
MEGRKIIEIYVIPVESSTSNAKIDIRSLNYMYSNITNMILIYFVKIQTLKISYNKRRLPYDIRPQFKT